MNEANRDMVAFTREGARAHAPPPPPSAMMAVHSPHREHAATAAAVTQSFKPKIAAKKPAGQDVHLAGYVQS